MTVAPHLAAVTRRPDIQGLRAIAVLLVVIFHADLPLPGGFAGVDVFFVISGFVITRLLLAELGGSGRVNWPQFYLRRVRRLLPALATLSVSVAVLALLGNAIGTQVMAAQTGLAATLFVANAHLYRAAPGYFSPGAEYNPMLHTWSLSVEEQFYLLYPLLLWLVWRWASRAGEPAVQRARIGFGLTALVGGSFVLCLGLTYGWLHLPGASAPRQFAFYASPTRAWEFGVGALLSWWGVPARWQQRSGWGLLLGLWGLALLGLSALGLDGRMPFPGWIAWGPVGGTALLILSGGCGHHVLTRLLAHPLLQWIGDRSYGWYLWHWPFAVFARTLWPGLPWAVVLASALSVVPAWASYRYIEDRLRHPSSAAATLRLGALCLLLPLCAFGGLWAANGQILGRPDSQPLAAAIALHADEVRHCEGLAPLQGAGVPGCTWAVPHPRGLVLLLGDSNAGHFTEAVVGAANRAGYDATVATLSACPWVDLQLYSHGEPQRACQDFVQQTLAALPGLHPSLVIVSTAADGYIEEGGTGLQAEPGGPVATTAQPRADLWTVGVERLLARINPVAPVLLVQPAPRFRHWALTQCAAGHVGLDPQACASSVSRAEVDAWRARAVASQTAALARHPGNEALDLTDRLCTAQRCDVLQDGVWLYRDGAHLSVPAARQLVPSFEPVIRRLARPN